MAKLSKVQAFYIDNNPKLTNSQLAKDLKIGIDEVRLYVEKHPRSKVEPQTLPSVPKKDLLARREGTVCMTQSQSEQADLDLAEHGRHPENSILKNPKLKNAIFVPDPSKPVT